MHFRQTLTAVILALALPTAVTAQDTGTPVETAADAPTTTEMAAPVAIAPRGSVNAAGEVSAPPAGMGQVVFFRPNSMMGAALWYKVREGGVELARITNGRYFVQPMAPGTHSFTAATENTDTLTLEVEEGETYYVRGAMTMGLIVYRANLAPSDKTQFRKDLRGMKPAEPLATQRPAKAN